MAASGERVVENGHRVINVHGRRRSITHGCRSRLSPHRGSLTGTVHMMVRVITGGGIVSVNINHHGSRWMAAAAASTGWGA